MSDREDFRRVSVHRELSRRSFLQLGASGLAMAGAAIIVAACGQSATPAPSQVAQSAPTTAPGAAPTVAATAAPTAAAASNPTAVTTSKATTATTGKPTPGGTLYAAAEVDPVSLDPHTQSNFSALQAYDHIYESLTAYDEKMNVIPSLATKWDISEDGKTYTFHLRPNVKFHNGQTLSANDVKYSIDRVLNPKTASPWKSWLGPMEAVKVVDPLTVQMVMGTPFPPLLSGLAGNRASGIMPAGLAEKLNLKIKAIGTGPFKLIEYVPLDHISYQKFTDYWNQPYPYMGGMVFKILQEESARLAGLKAGQIEYAELSAQGAAQIKGAAGISILESPYAWVDLTENNLSVPALKDARVRRALRMTIDIKSMIQKAAFGAAVPSGPVPAGYGQWPLPQNELPYLTPDLAGAKKLLAEAGHPNGQGLAPIVIKCSPQYPDFVSNAEIMKASFAQIGVQSTVQQEEWGTFVKDSAPPGFNYQQSNTADTFRPDPDGFLYPYFHSKGNLNPGNYSNPKVDSLLDQARTISDQSQRVTLYHDIQKILLQDCPTFFWYTKYNIEATGGKLHGYAQSFTGRRYLLYKAWLTG